MLAVLLWAYAKLDKKHVFILLGIALSLQEELWIPVIFLFVYSLNNMGLKRSAANAVGAVFVFLLFNAYFILLNPTTYFNSVFAPVGALIMPSGSALFGFPLITSYHVSLLVLPKLFYLSILFLAILLLYLNKKELIPLFSMIPFLFLSHALVSYFTLFTFFFVFSLFIKEKSKGEGYIKRYLGRKRSTYIVLASLFAIAATAASLAAISHNQYISNFDINSLNQSVIVSGNYTYYNATLTYNGLKNNTLYVAIVGVSNGTIGYYGFFNQSLTGQNFPCNSIECTINVNRILLNESSGTYPVRLKAITGPYSTGPFTLIIYNREYYYLSGPVKPEGD